MVAVDGDDATAETVNVEVFQAIKIVGNVGIVVGDCCHDPFDVGGLVFGLAEEKLAQRECPNVAPPQGFRVGASSEFVGLLVNREGVTQLAVFVGEIEEVRNAIQGVDRERVWWFRILWPPGRQLGGLSCHRDFLPVFPLPVGLTIGAHPRNAPVN